jgi:hypothetical protein
MSDESRGIYQKYHVRRLHDPEGKHLNCSYFVLDLKHDRFAIAALRAYSLACEKEFPELAKDIDDVLKLPFDTEAEYFPFTADTAMHVKMAHGGDANPERGAVRDSGGGK